MTAIVTMAYTDYDRISDSERSEGLTKIGYALGEYARDHSTTDAILDAYQQEEFKGVFIRKEVRALMDEVLAARTQE